jgi:hypothetical protein
MKLTLGCAVAFSFVAFAQFAEAQGFAPGVAPIYNGIGEIKEFTVCNTPSWDNRPWCGKFDVALNQGYGTWYRSGDSTQVHYGVTLISPYPPSRNNQVHLLYSAESGIAVGAGFVARIPGVDGFFGWSPGEWVEGPGIQGTPSAVQMWFTPGLSPDERFLFVRAGNNSVVVRPIEQPMAAWTNLGGQTYYSPSAVSSQSGKMDVFITDADTHHVKYRSYVEGWLPGWTDLGGWVDTAPAAASLGGNTLAVYARSADSFLYARWKTGTQWSAWQRLGQDFVLTSDPVAYGDPSTNKTYIFARGADMAIWVFDTLGDNAWTSMGGDFS